MGALRLRHCELLDALGQRLIEDSQSFGELKTKAVQAFIKTCAAVNYSPGSLANLISKHLSLNEQTSEDSSPLTDLKNRIDLVWSLAILDQANAEHLNTVLTQDVFQQIQSKFYSAKSIDSTISINFMHSNVFCSRRSDQCTNCKCSQTFIDLFIFESETFKKISQTEFQHRAIGTTINYEERQYR